MDLTDYLEREHLSVLEFSRRAGLSSKSVYMYLWGKRVPTGETAKKIVEATNGEVTYEDIWSKKTT